ncbi:Uncharacterised protein [Mycobacteroides abscessus subsp. abscessus]|uniref:hypothetical protein n=1 Tax=Mycobacteroides abscessus TaxID=36809 RepID=UPI000926E91B|nr:hypothetical protein [Mycobacteroides abscessus]SIJ20685.1 Uncharacterised protein [Mycobacteroides abscessus subsp. abscessus]SLH39583.1 Uncharacterised protein [Mycobacteroides abscessus subsp. abscessus]
MTAPAHRAEIDKRLYQAVVAGQRFLDFPADYPLEIGAGVQLVAIDYNWPNGMGRAIGPADVPPLDVVVVAIEPAQQPELAKVTFELASEVDPA